MTALTFLREFYMDEALFTQLVCVELYQLNYYSQVRLP